jgi:hypothetical protein
VTITILVHLIPVLKENASSSKNHAMIMMIALLTIVTSRLVNVYLNQKIVMISVCVLMTIVTLENVIMTRRVVMIMTIVQLIGVKPVLDATMPQLAVMIMMNVQRMIVSLHTVVLMSR